MKLLMYVNIAMLFFVIQCSEKEKMIGKMTVIQEIKLEKPMELGFIKGVEENFAAINFNDYSLVLISPEGKVLWTYNKQGKGPGEYSQGIGIFGYYNKTMYVVDNGVSKILLFTYDDSKKIFEYSEEYPFNEGQGLDSLFITETGRVLVSVPIGKHGLIEMDLKCNIVNRFLSQELPSKDADIVKARMDATFDLSGDNTYLLRSNIFSNFMQFMKKTDNGYELIKTRTAFRSSKNTSNISQKGNKESLTITITVGGVITSHFMNNDFYTMVATPAESKESIVEVYTVNGAYKGYYLLEGNNDESIRNIYFRNDGTFCFMKAVRNADGKTYIDVTKIYIARFEDTK